MRGCVAELPDYDINNCKDNKYCNICREQGCNTEKAPSESKPTKKCIKCNDAETCPWGFPEDKAEECDGFPSACFTYQLENDTVIRGCGNDKFVCDPKADVNCLICQKDGCNNGNVEFHECYQCQSDKVNQTCAEKSEDILPAKCKMQIYDKRGCYTRTESKFCKKNNHNLQVLTKITKSCLDKIVSRGCITDLEDKELTSCKADEKRDKCDLCYESKCNNKDPPNSGSVFTHFSFVSLIIISGLITVKNQI